MLFIDLVLVLRILEGFKDPTCFRHPLTPFYRYSSFPEDSVHILSLNCCYQRYRIDLESSIYCLQWSKLWREYFSPLLSHVIAFNLVLSKHFRIRIRKDPEFSLVLWQGKKYLNNLILECEFASIIKLTHRNIQLRINESMFSSYFDKLFLAWQ